MQRVLGFGYLLFRGRVGSDYGLIALNAPLKTGWTTTWLQEYKRIANRDWKEHT